MKSMKQPIFSGGILRFIMLTTLSQKVSKISSFTIWSSSNNRSIIRSSTFNCRRDNIIGLQRSFTSSSQLLSASRDNLLEILEQEPIITSTKSKTVKLYQSISSKAKARNEHQLTIIEGHRFVTDTLAQQSSRGLFRDVLVSYDALFHPKLGEPLSKQLEELIMNGRRDRNQQNCRVRLAEPNVVNAACDTVTPQGIVALVDIPKPYELSSSDPKSADESQKEKSKFFLLLDGISDPGNVGTLIRSAKATGIEAVILLPNSCDVFNPKALRSAMGTTFQVPICSVSSWENCFDMMLKSGVKGEDIYAATMEGSERNDNEGLEGFESIPHYDIDWHGSNSGGKALIIGKEGTGLSNQVREAFSKGDIRTVHVPMELGIESLNAAVCGSVIMFEYHRQTRLMK